MRPSTGAARRAQILPITALLIVSSFLLLTLSTCVPTDVSTGGAGAVSGGVTVVNQTGRELTADELNQLLDNAGNERFVVVFLSPTPGPVGPQGPVGPAGASAADTAKPMIGEVRMWAGSFGRPPAGWVVCDGRMLPRGEFAELFAAIGYRWGGDGGEQFQLPDFRNRSPMGAESEGADGAPLTSVAGQAVTLGGSATHALTTDELAAHDHDMSHTHDVFGGVSATVFGNLVFQEGPGRQAFVSTGPASPSRTGLTGVGRPHAILDPYFAISYIMYTGQ